MKEASSGRLRDVHGPSWSVQGARNCQKAYCTGPTPKGFPPEPPEFPGWDLYQGKSMGSHTLLLGQTS